MLCEDKCNSLDFESIHTAKNPKRIQVKKLGTTENLNNHGNPGILNTAIFFSLISMLGLNKGKQFSKINNPNTKPQR